MTTNKTVLAWIDEMKALVSPENVVFVDGSEEQIEKLRAEMKILEAKNRQLEIENAFIKKLQELKGGGR